MVVVVATVTDPTDMAQQPARMAQVAEAVLKQQVVLAPADKGLTAVLAAQVTAPVQEAVVLERPVVTEAQVNQVTAVLEVLVYNLVLLELQLIMPVAAADVLTVLV